QDDPAPARARHHVRDHRARHGRDRRAVRSDLCARRRTHADQGHVPRSRFEPPGDAGLSWKGRMSAVLSTSGLHAGYGAGDILKGIDLALDEGRILSLIGPNGSGKSTLVKTLAGLLEARQGDVLFAGERVNGWSPPRRVKGGLAYVPQ